MSSRFSNLAHRRGAPLLTRALAERDSQGNFEKITCTLPSGKDVPLVGVIVGKLAVERLEDDRGNAKKKETVTIRIPLHQNDVEERIYLKAKFDIPKFGDRQFVPRSEGSEISGGFLVYGLEREPLMRMDPKEDATI